VETGEGTLERRRSLEQYLGQETRSEGRYSDLKKVVKGERKKSKYEYAMIPEHRFGLARGATRIRRPMPKHWGKVAKKPKEKKKKGWRLRRARIETGHLQIKPPKDSGD